jgi:hypothetical protein
MKLNRKTLRKMILNEIKNINESQKEVGLPHMYTDLELYHHAFSFLRQNPDLENAPPEVRQKGNKLLKILHNAVQKAVQHQEYRQGDFGAFRRGDVDAYKASKGKKTTQEETAYMREVQGKLKMARNALASALGLRHKYSGRSEAFGDMIRAEDPTGEKQRSGLRPDQVSDAYHDAIGRRHDDNDDYDF